MINNNTPNQIAIYDISTNYSYTYKDMNRNILKISEKIMSLGVQKGSRVCVFLESNIKYIHLFYALYSIDAICISINKELYENYFKEICADVSPDFCITEQDAENIIDSYQIERFSTETSGTTIPPQIALITYSSGTLSKPKGIMFSKDNIECIPAAVNEFIELNNEKILAPLCMYHMYGFSIFLSAFKSKATLFISDYTLSKEALLKLLDTQEISAVFVNGKIMELFHSNEIREHNRLKKLKFMSSASYEIHKKDVYLFTKQNPSIQIYTFYALSEVPRATCLKNPHLVSNEFIPIGKTPSYLKMRVEPLLLASTFGSSFGEIVFEGDLVAKGYIGNEFNGVKLIPDKTFYTGDIVKIHDNLLLEYAGRKQDLIHINDKTIVPREMEQLYCNLCCYNKCEVIFDKIKIFVHLEKNSNKICQKCTARLKANSLKITHEYALLVKNIFWEKFPVNTQGKVIKKELYNVVE